MYLESLVFIPMQDRILERKRTFLASPSSHHKTLQDVCIFSNVINKSEVNVNMCLERIQLKMKFICLPIFSPLSQHLQLPSNYNGIMRLSPVFNNVLFTAGTELTLSSC